MRFMIMGLASKDDDPNVVPAPEAFVAMQAYNEDLAKRGILLAAEGLSPMSKGARLESRGGEMRVIDGPFTEAKEFIAGFTIIKVNSLQEAIDIVKGMPIVFPDRNNKVEIRKLMDVEDFGENFTPNEEVAKVKY